MNAVLLAHQGGWDEALLVTLPIAFIFVVLWFAKRKAEQLDNERGSTTVTDGSAAEAPGTTLDT